MWQGRTSCWLRSAAILIIAAAACPIVPTKGADGPSWAPAPWRFLRDGWPNGIGFDCSGCSGAFSVYVRVKIGFCDCSKGVSDDDEIDRVGDVDLVSPYFRPSDQGRDASVAGAMG